MTNAVDTVLKVLEEAGFERLPRPLVVAGSTFDFDAAVKGTGTSHDLVVVATSTTPQRRLVLLLSALSRTLDQVESTRPVSVVLLGQRPNAPILRDLERYARVLAIESDAPDDNQVRRTVDVLLPLTLPSALTRGRDPLLEVANRLGSALSEEHQKLIDAAKTGPDSVRESLRRYIDAAVQAGHGEGGDS